MTVSLNTNFVANATETVTLGLDQAGDASVVHKIATSQESTLNASSTPAVSKAYSDEITLSGGAATIDLTDCPHATVNGTATAVDMTGLKVQFIKILADSTNTETITIEVGATNGYNIFGDADGEITLGAGAQAMFQFNEHLPDVGASAKDIDISSSDTDAKFQVMIVAG